MAIMATLLLMSLSNFTNKTGQALNYNYPKVLTQIRRTGIFNGSCYAPKVQEVFTATTHGYILVWIDDLPENERAIDAPYDGRKKHLKTVSLQTCEITVVTIHKDMLVTGNSKGHITFYDYQLRVLYWCKSDELDSIRWISFSLHPNSMAPISMDKLMSNSKMKAALSSNLSINLGYILEKCNCNNSLNKMIRNKRSGKEYSPTDATLQGSPFNVDNFFACSSTGVIVSVEISKRKYTVMLQYSVAAVTSIDTYPESEYIIVGDVQGNVYLYNYKEYNLIKSRSMPSIPNFLPVLEKQVVNENIVYVTCPHIHEPLKAVTAIKFSPRCDMLVCGLENGAIWILHCITLEVMDEIPYKHSSVAINKIAFTWCAGYMAYTDNALTVVVFKRNDPASSTGFNNVWNLLGKYHSHYLPIRDIFFGPIAPDSNVPRFFSLGEDQEIIEYDLPHSGPYPVPGLKILRINRIEQTAVPLCLTCYHQSTETYFIIANSEYKYKMFSIDIAMTIRGTYLGPTFGQPVQQIQILTNKFMNDKDYMVFATERLIGLQLLPLDGNPYKIVCMTGHPKKIINFSVSNNGDTIFTIGCNDPCVLMWNIKHRLEYHKFRFSLFAFEQWRQKSVDVMTQLGGEGLSPFYCLIEGGKDGWLINEMKDLFYYAQILHQGENTTAARIVSDTVDVEQISNLMRAIGYYPSNAEIDNMMAERYYMHYIKTGELIDTITFEEFVKLYVNHRPVFGIRMRQVKKAFRAFVKENFIEIEYPTLTREQFMDILFGKTFEEDLEEDKFIGEPLTLEEAYTYLRLLLDSDKFVDDHDPSVSFDFRFLPARISYKDFIVDIMGVELPRESRADD